MYMKIFFLELNEFCLALSLTMITLLVGVVCFFIRIVFLQINSFAKICLENLLRSFLYIYVSVISRPYHNDAYVHKKK